MNDTKRPYAPVLNADIDETDPDDRFDDLPTDQELNFNQTRDDEYSPDDDSDFEDFGDDEFDDDDLEFIEDESSGF